jgi:2-polyprenyl-3-methyl-5-hydroxy-6-metoxy-1,4-benzoquinol methylase
MTVLLEASRDDAGALGVSIKMVLGRLFRTRKNTVADATDFASMLRLTVPESSNPNINELWRLSKDLEATKLTVKFFGYELAKALLSSLPPLPPGGPFQMAMTGRPATQADLEANWSRYWSAQIREPHAIHRRVWEHVYVLQALSQLGRIKPGMKGLGLGTSGPLASYFASQGCNVTIVDGEEPSRNELHRSSLLQRDVFDKRVQTRASDLAALPADLAGFDFVWSIAKLQHTGSIARGIECIENLAGVLKPGGVMVHTTEFSFAIDDQTIDNWGTVLFQRRHFEDMAQRLMGRGCKVFPLDFDIGSRPLDRFIDVPPFEMPGSNIKNWSHDAMHLKANVDGFPCTSFGLIAVKNG